METDLVQIDVVVRNKDGRAVPDLNRDHFHLFDNGVERPINAFSVEKTSGTIGHLHNQETSPTTPADSVPNTVSSPRYVALFFDDVDTQDGPYAGSLRRAQIAVEDFLQDSLTPGTQLAIFTASGTEVLDFTADRLRLIDAIKALKPHPRVSEKGLESCPTISPYRAYLISQKRDRSIIWTVMTEAGMKNCPIAAGTVITIAEETWRRVRETSSATLRVLEQVVNHLGQRPGGRMLLLTSPGFITGTLQEQQDQVVADAHRAGVVINALDAKGLFSELPAGSRPEDWSAKNGIYPDTYVKLESMALGDRLMLLDEPMGDLSARTGGLFFHDNNNLKAGFRQLLTPPDCSYKLTFKPDNVPPDGRFHSVKVTVAGSRSYSVTSSPGYFAPNGHLGSEKLRSRLASEVLLQEQTAEFLIDVAAQETTLSAGERRLTVNTHFDIAHLHFHKEGDRRMQTVILVTAILDSKQTLVAAKEGTMSFALKDDTYARLSQSGVNAKLSLEVPPGSYTLREVVQDQIEGKIACLSRAINVP